MNIPPASGIAASASARAGASAGTEVARAALDAAAQRQRVEAGRRADRAAGVDGPDADNLATDNRDGDGRQAWRFPPPASAQHGDSPPPPCPAPGDERGGHIDLCG